MKHYYLTILFIFIIFKLSSQNSFEYIVEEIPYQTFQEQDMVQFYQDDVHSSIITIPFDFNFFELGDVNQFVVGSNGSITFNVALAGTFQDWQFNPNNLIPSQGLPKPAILGPYHDMDNFIEVTNGGAYSGITGSSPNRRFHITFEDIPQFSCYNLLSTTQIILHETSGIIDVIITNKPICLEWNNGLAALGIQADVNGILHGISAPGRNTGVWEAHEEAWRFTPTSFLSDFDVVICDVDNDATQLFNIDAYKDELMSLFNLDPNVSTIDITDFNNASVSGDINVALGDNLPGNAYTININNGSRSFNLTFALINCENDGDTDGIPSGDEDINGNGNLNDDDTDGDGIPNYLDDDDDGDNVLTNIEVLFGGRNTSGVASTTFLDTDGDGIPNHLDFDDDGDGVLTMDEDYNGNGDPTDDDLNLNGIPDYLDNLQLSVAEFNTDTILFSIYPNPSKDHLYIKFTDDAFWGDTVNTRIYDYQGRLISEINSEISNHQAHLDVSNLASGNYLLIVKKNNFVKARKFVVD